MKIAKASLLGFAVLKNLNKIGEFILKARPYEIEKGKIDTTYRNILRCADKSEGKHIKKILIEGLKELKKIELDKNKDCNIPTLSIILDEMTGEAGYITRIEAFTDMIRRKKEMLAGSDLVSSFFLCLRRY